MVGCTQTMWCAVGRGRVRVDIDTPDGVAVGGIIEAGSSLDLPLCLWYNRTD